MTTADIRVINSDDLVALNGKGVKYRLNRTVTDEFLATLDPEGNHICSLILWGHNLDSARYLHHRMMVLCKVKDSDDPERIILDIMDEDWKHLTTVDGYRQAADAVGGV